jgi:diacylglycerol kinase (ATP)
MEPGQIPIIAGGDGSVAMVAAELLRAGPCTAPLGILPLGTGNIVAETVGIRTVEDALRAFRNPTVRRLDVLRTSSPIAPIALVSISAGFEGDFMHRYGSLRHLGRVAAAFAGIPLVGRCRMGIQLEVENKSLCRADEEVFSAGIYNTRSYAGRIVMSPDADPTDGVFEVVAYRRALDYWGSLAAAIAGRTHRPLTVVRQQCRTAMLSCDGPLQIDGEPLTPSQLRVTVDPLALPLLTLVR